ncbi:hypothetical protein DFH29DRAFT_877969 [Suillus ampliporus]|nr:hypothetical protein DFH29DRAFT_877969 [Suillus ampliporus]
MVQVSTYLGIIVVVIAGPCRVFDFGDMFGDGSIALSSTVIINAQQLHKIAELHEHAYDMTGDLFEPRNASMKVLITGDGLQDGKLEIDLGLSNNTNEPLYIVIPEFLVNMVEVFQCKKMGGFYEHPVLPEWFSNTIFF